MQMLERFDYSRVSEFDENYDHLEECGLLNPPANQTSDPTRYRIWASFFPWCWWLNVQHSLLSHSTTMFVYIFLLATVHDDIFFSGNRAGVYKKDQEPEITGASFRCHGHHRGVTGWRGAFNFWSATTTCQSSHPILQPAAVGRGERSQLHEANDCDATKGAAPCACSSRRPALRRARCTGTAGKSLSLFRRRVRHRQPPSTGRFPLYSHATFKRTGLYPNLLKLDLQFLKN